MPRSVRAILEAPKGWDCSIEVTGNPPGEPDVIWERVFIAREELPPKPATAEIIARLTALHIEQPLVPVLGTDIEPVIASATKEAARLLMERAIAQWTAFHQFESDIRVLPPWKARIEAFESDLWSRAYTAFQDWFRTFPVSRSNR